MKYPDYNADVYKLKTTGVYLYEQYKALDWMKNFKDILNGYIQKNYFEGIGDYIQHKNIVYPKGDYVIFYAREYLGLKRPIYDNLDVDDTETDDRFYGYDVGVLYDVGDIWDYHFAPNPLMTAAMLKKYMSYIMDYSQETWTIDYVMHMPEVILDYFNAIDIKIKWTPHKIYFVMPTSEKFYRRQEITSFLSLTKTDNYEMNMPFGDCYEFVQGDHLEGDRPDRKYYMLAHTDDVATLFVQYLEATWTGGDWEMNKEIDKNKLNVYAIWTNGDKVKLKNDEYVITPTSFNKIGTQIINILYTDDMNFTISTTCKINIV